MEKAVKEIFDTKAANEIDFLMERNTAFFAGGDISDEAKEAYFQAVMRAYLTCKEKTKKHMRLIRVSHKALALYINRE